MNAIQRLILKDHPNYDFSRYRFRECDIANNILNMAQILVMESALDYVTGIVIKAGFGCPKGLVERFGYIDLEYISQGEYRRQPYNIQKKLRYEAGDIIKHDDHLFCVLDRDGQYLTVLSLKEDKSCGLYKGARYNIVDPYWEYHLGGEYKHE